MITRLEDFLNTSLIKVERYLKENVWFIKYKPFILKALEEVLTLSYYTPFKDKRCIDFYREIQEDDSIRLFLINFSTCLWEDDEINMYGFCSPVGGYREYFKDIFKFLGYELMAEFEFTEKCFFDDGTIEYPTRNFIIPYTYGQEDELLDRLLIDRDIKLKEITKIVEIN